MEQYYVTLNVGEWLDPLFSILYDNGFFSYSLKMAVKAIPLKIEVQNTPVPMLFGVEYR